MALYYIGKNEKDITGISSFAGSETIYGSNEHENYAAEAGSKLEAQSSKPQSKH